MSRPTDWSPLDRDGDPVPANEVEFKAEAQYYSTVATRITEQVARLRRIGAADGTLKGEFSHALKDSCGELADDLTKAEGRFSTTARELEGLEDDLADALRKTSTAHDDAVDARERMQQAVTAGYEPGLPTPRPDHRPDGGSETGAGEGTDLEAAKRKYETAEGDLARAKKDCDDAVTAWNEAAEPAARRIRDASDDDLKDGRFEGFKAWVRANADLLREISKWLGRIVLVLAVAIVLLSNPAGWLVAAALLASVALLAVDSMLAVAGEGSWTDVAFSALGVLTLGAGSLLGKVARFGRSLTLFKAGNQQGLRAGMQALRNSFNNPGLRGGLTNLGNVFRPSTYATAIGEGFRVARSIRMRPLPTAGFAPQSLLFGRSNVALADDLARIRGEFGDDVVNGLYSGSMPWLKGLAGTGGVATGVDALMDEGQLGLGCPNQWLDHTTTLEWGSL